MPLLTAAFPLQDLFVAPVFEDHNLILNKYNVSPYHMLVTTKEFQPQTDFLNKEDFKAM